jgi:glycosyltransferase involved in cell wall biosynthesis
MVEVCTLINTLGRGGAEKLLVDIVGHDDDLDVEYTVCYFGLDHEFRPDLEDAARRVHALDARFLYDPLAVYRLSRFLSRERFDVLHAHLPYASVVGRAVGARSDVDHILTTQHNDPSNYRPETRVLERYTRSIDDVTVAVSTGVKREFDTTGHDWRVIPNGIDVESFHESVRTADPPSAFESIAAESDDVFLNVARYRSQKRQELLIDAMDEVVQELPDAVLFVVGWGPLEEELRDRVRAAGLEGSVFVTGRVPSVTGYYRVANVFVSSSIHEGFPITFLEAMAAELPIVATEIPGALDPIEDGHNGDLVPPESATSLAEGMVRMATDPDSDRYGERGYRRALEEFSVRQTAAEYARLYEEIGDE